MNLTVLDRAIAYKQYFFVVVVSFGMAWFTGVIAAFLSPPDIFTVFGIIGLISVITAFCYTLIAAINGRPWALGLYMALSIFLIDASFRQRELTAASIDAQTLMKLFVWGGGLLIGLAHLRLARGMWRGALPWMLAYALLAFVTTTYSIIPSYTFGAGFALLSFLVFSIAIVVRLSEFQVIYASLIGLGIALLLAIVMYFISPNHGMAIMEGGTVLRLAGLSGSPNNLGRIASLFVFMLLLLVLRGYWRWNDWRIPLLLVVALFVLFQTQSRTALISAILALGYIMVRGRPWLILSLAICSAVVALLWVIGDFVKVSDIATLLSRTGKASEITTATGRTDIWAFVVQKISESPWFGYGYGSTRLLIPQGFQTFWGWTSTSAHNMMLQSLVTVGVLGTIPLAIALGRQVLRLSQSSPLHDGILVYVIASGLFEAGAIGPAPNVLTLLWLVSIAWASKESMSLARANLKVM